MMYIVKPLSIQQVDALKMVRRHHTLGVPPSIIDGRTLNALLVRKAVEVKRNRRRQLAVFITDRGRGYISAYGR